MISYNLIHCLISFPCKMSFINLLTSQSSLSFTARYCDFTNVIIPFRFVNL